MAKFIVNKGGPSKFVPQQEYVVEASDITYAGEYIVFLDVDGVVFQMRKEFALTVHREEL